MRSPFVFHWSYDQHMERFLASLAAVSLGLVLFPIVMALAIWGWVKVGGPDGLGIVCALAAGVAVFVFLVWKAPAIIRRGLDRLRAKSPEPFYSCLAMGFAWALTIGALMAVPILLLGHTRPEGWELDRIPPFVVGAFLLGMIFGVPLGRERSRERKSQAKIVAV
jgi:protein-S-isoprenylcysteine O-methyltransferase Ste14